MNANAPSNYSHLELFIEKSEYKYVMLATVSDYIAAFAKIANSDKGFPYAFFCTPGEYSYIVPMSVDLGVPENSVDGWSCFRIVGDMPFGSVKGLISRISTVLVSGDIGTCVVSSFKTDLFFVRTYNLNHAKDLLINDGWRFISP